MTGEILNQIEDAKRKGIKLYICGVQHNVISLFLTDRLLIPLKNIVNKIVPNIVLLEGRTPESTYQRGIATGDFIREAHFVENNPEAPYVESPTLIEIVEAVDKIGCIVKGIDLPRKDLEKLEKKYGIRNTKLLDFYKRLHNESKTMLEEKPWKLFDSQYHKMEKLVDRLYWFEPQGSDNSDPVNDSQINLEKLSSIVNEFPELHSFFNKLINRLRKLKINNDGYDNERDAEIFNNLIREYTGNNRILVCLGSYHIEDSPLIRSVEEAEIPYIKFINYKPLL